jgi:hypothetical protein
VAYRRPRPTPKKQRPAYETTTRAVREALADKAEYVGSPHHTDIPKLGRLAAPRRGAVTIAEAKEADQEPDCTLCPRKWAKNPEGVQELLKEAIRLGQYVEPQYGFPARVWARDPDDPKQIYEGKSEPDTGEYHGFPLTEAQARKLPIPIP